MVLYQPPLLLTYRTQRSYPVMTGLDPVIFIGWLLIGIATFAFGYGQPMAGSSRSSPAMTGVESRYFRRWYQSANSESGQACPGRLPRLGAHPGSLLC